MAKRSNKTYSHAEKVALVADVERLYAAGDRTYASIARELGINDSSYHAWVRLGIKPAVAAGLQSGRAAHRVFTASERERLVAEIDALRARGHSMRAASQAVGISDKSYRKWKDDACPPLPMRVVEVTALVPTVATAPALLPPKPAPVDGVLSLLAPGGYRIEGLGIETAARLLRALSC